MKFVLLLFALIHCALSWLPKIVWTYWNDPLQYAPQLIRAFHINHIQFTKGWQLRHLNGESVWNWLGHLPLLKETIESDVFQNQTLAVRCDMLRISLLKQYGGIYFDMTTILTRNLDWILQLKEEKFYLGQTENQEPDVFIHYAKDSNGPKIFDSKTKRNVPIMPNMEMFFMGGKAKSKYFTDLYQAALNLKIQSFKLYGGNNKKSLLIEKALEAGTPVVYSTQTNYYQFTICAAYIVAKKQKQLQIIHRPAEIEPLSLHYYKMVLMNVLDSGYRFQESQTYFIKYIAMMSIDQLKQQNVYPQYFIKLWKDLYQFLDQYLKKSSYLCLNWWYITDSSALNQFVLKIYNEKMHEIYLDKIRDVPGFLKPYCLKMFIIFVILPLALGFGLCKLWRKRQKLQKGHIKISQNENLLEEEK